MSRPSPRPPSEGSAPRGSARGGNARFRPLDLALVVGCSVVTAATLLVWTGVVPSGLYASSSSQWSLEVPTCTYNGSSYVQHAFPLWATVHVRWTATGGNVWYLVQGQGTTFLSQSGTNGSGAFLSNSYPAAFWALALTPANTSTCPSILVLTTATYTV